MSTKPTKEELRKIFSENIANITFLKIDGTKRSMICTLKADLLPTVEKTESKQKKQPNENVLPVWDLEQKAFRSFRVDSLIEYSIVND